jgi:hypothetical protein
MIFQKLKMIAVRRAFPVQNGRMILQNWKMVSVRWAFAAVFFQNIRGMLQHDAT